MEDKQKFQLGGLKWLYELEVLNHPQVINNIKLNVLMCSKHIKEVELLMFREKKSILVLIELSWFGRKFNKKQIFEEVYESLQQLLPTFKFRVTDDPKIMMMSVEKVKQALSGGLSAKNLNSIPSSNELVGNEQNIRANTETKVSEAIGGRVESLPTNTEEQSNTREELLPEVNEVYSKEQ